MNTTGPVLPISEVDQLEETNCTLSVQSYDNPTSKVSENIIGQKLSNEENSISSNAVVSSVQESNYEKESENSELVEKCPEHRSPPSGNEKSSTSPEWQCEGAGDGLAQVCSDEDTEPRDSIWRVPKSLNELLNDASAIVPFQTFVQPDTKAYDMLLFWFACNGLQRVHREDLLKFTESAEVIWIKFIRNQKVKLSDDLYECLKTNIVNCNLSPLLSIFTAAQKEIETQMQYIFVKFCQSDIYVSWLFRQDDPYFNSSPDDVNLLLRPLPTLHEDSELAAQPVDKLPPRLSSKNLMRSVNYRDELNSISDSCERFPSIAKHESPYHLGFPVGPTVSTLDSELHGVSSGALTDDTFSFTSSSLDGSCKARMNARSRREHHRMRQSARMNPEPPGRSLALTFIGPGPGPRPKKMENNPVRIEEFANKVIKKLEVVQQEIESKEKLEQSLLKMAQNENTSDQQRRLHAENSLPPNILAGKLAERVQQADLEPSQSILDDHVARVWDSPNSPGSPQPIKTKQLPHMNYSHSPKLSCRNYATPKSLNLAHYMRYSAMGAEGHVSYGKGSPSSHHPVQSLSGRIMGLDVNSTISSDSGNVADYHDACERRIPKSRSMPDAMENNVASDGGSTNRRLGCGSRRLTRHPPPETDSGVSVVSDSNFSPVGLYMPSDRISSWLSQSRHYTSCDGTTHSTYQYDKADCSKAKGTRSVHTVAGSTSPGTQRRSGSSSRRSQCSSSMSGKTCYSAHQHKMSPSNTTICSETHRNIPISPNSKSYCNDRRNRLSISSSQCMQLFTDEHVPKTLSTKKQAKTDSFFVNEAMYPESPSASSPAALQAKPMVSPMTTIVYNFQDDKWPFKTKVDTNCVTLKKFKEDLPKKGNYRYFFKKFCDDIGGVVFEEITDDSEIVPLFEGKIISQIRKDE